MNFKKIFFASLLFFFAGTAAALSNTGQIGFGRREIEAPAKADFSVALGGNAYVVRGKNGARIDSRRGLVAWKDADSGVSVFFRFARAQSEIGISILAKGTGTIAVNAAGNTFFVKLDDAANFKKYAVGTANFPQSGYNRVNFRGKELGNDGTFGEISELILEDVVGEMNFVRDFDVHFGRRGPSVHLLYAFPKGKNIEYFYNELTIPKGEDVVGSFFMSNGFRQGYFGLQVNSRSERRVLFSVWSSEKIQKAKDVPERLRIQKLRQGKFVYVGDFGNEGSGAQSILRFQWKAGTTYKFLTKIRPDSRGNTDYTAFFGVPDEENSAITRWHLIASFKKPGISTWHSYPHSFLENFEPEQGFIARKANFANQWARDSSGNWHEITAGVFSCDATGRAKMRVDFSGGLTDDNRAFFLQNCGFSNSNTPAGTRFVRESSEKKPPVINFSFLEKI